MICRYEYLIGGNCNTIQYIGLQLSAQNNKTYSNYFLWTQSFYSEKWKQKPHLYSLPSTNISKLSMSKLWLKQSSLKCIKLQNNFIFTTLVLWLAVLYCTVPDLIILDSPFSVFPAKNSYVVFSQFLFPTLTSEINEKAVN